MCSPVEGGLAGIVALPVLAAATSNVRHIPYVSITAVAEAGLRKAPGVLDLRATCHHSRGLTMNPAWIALMLGVTLAGTGHAQAAATTDPYLWLEDVHAERPMEWVKQQNAITAQR